MGLRFGVLGTGYWAQEAHATALAGHPDTELVGVWGRDPAKTEAFAARFGIQGHVDLDRLLAEVDAVAVAVPPDVQAELALRAATAGRHLLLDKPLALSLDGAERVVEAVAANRVASLVFFTLRFLPEVAAWVEETGAAGDWQGGDGGWLGTVFSEPDSPFAAAPWRRRKGALWDLGPHMLSLALPVLGPVERVTAATGPGDTAHLILGHHGGALRIVVGARHDLEHGGAGIRLGEHLGLEVLAVDLPRQLPGDAVKERPTADPAGIQGEQPGDDRVVRAEGVGVPGRR